VAKNNKDHLHEGVGQDSDSWGLLFSATEGPSVYKVKAGNVVACLFDQSDYPAIVSYMRDESVVEGARVTGMKGPVVPAISVENGAEVEVIFDSQLLENTVPTGFSPIIFSQNFMF
jgi:hypothetical protein